MQLNKLETFNQYFQIAESIKVNINPVAMNQVPQTQLALEQSIPPLFRLANEVNTLEQTALRPLRHLGDFAEDLALYLKAQSRKLDLIMAHILSTDTEQDIKLNTLSYGGGGIVLDSDVEYQEGQMFNCKVFLEVEAAAVFCFAELIQSVQLDNKMWRYTLLFSPIREEDQELLVRASLHAQSRLLKSNSKHQLK